MTAPEVVDILTNGTIMRAELGADGDYIVLELDTGVRVYADAPTVYLNGKTLWSAENAS